MATVEEFEIAARAVSTRVVRVPANELEETVIGILRSLDAVRLVSDSRRVILREFVRSSAAEADCGITDGEWGIASTGSVILPMTAERHRATSLVPPVSLIILSADRILNSLPEAIAKIGDSYMKQPQKPSSIVVVTGPSRTADIELNLVMGVHGPKELIVVLVEN
jgi:L-lactate utilization protein LutC